MTMERAAAKAFSWPDGKKAAVSLSFDDGRASQIERGVPLLDQYAVKGTFYVLPSSVETRLDQWCVAAVHGHELGNHTVTHPCGGNFSFARGNPLEEYTLDRMEAELIEAQDALEALLGHAPTTFAYPCGQKYVGRGAQVHSYVPVVAQLFTVGRGYRDEGHNVPGRCDLAQVYGVEFDARPFDEVREWIEQARTDGGWLVLAGHDVGEAGRRQTVREDTLHRLCEYCLEADHAIWIDTVATIGSYVAGRAGTTPQR